MKMNDAKEHSHMGADAPDTIPATFIKRLMGIFDMTDAPHGIICKRCSKAISRGWTRKEGMICLTCAAREVKEEE